MWHRWRNASDLWLASGGYLVLLVIGLQLGTILTWAGICALVAALALRAWQVALRRRRALHDTPSSRVASAAQGFVRLQGRGKALGGPPLLAPLTQLPCLWYQYKIEVKHDRQWATEEQGRSSVSFLLDDGSAECVVDPEGAQVLPQRRDSWTQGDRRYTQSLLLAQETLHVLGEFHSHSGADLALDPRRDVGERLEAWKADMPALRQRHDRNGDGQIDLEEWEAVRQAAQAEVAQEHAALRATPQSHHLRQPHPPLPFLISAVPIDRLARRLRGWAYAHATVFLAALAGLGWCLQRLSGGAP